MIEMEKFRYYIEENVIDVNRPQNIEGMYRVEWDGIYIGYIYVCGINEDVGRPVWAATTEYVRLYVEDLGRLIEDSGMMF